MAGPGESHTDISGLVVARLKGKCQARGLSAELLSSIPPEGLSVPQSTFHNVGQTSAWSIPSSFLQFVLLPPNTSSSSLFYPDLLTCGVYITPA